MSEKNSKHELYLTRVYDAPVQMVWEAWNDPKQVSQWWGPRGFTITNHKKDLRPGGIWHYTMHGPDGTDYQNKTLYHEVIEFKKLVYDHGGNDEQDPMFQVTVLFEEVKGKTKLEFTMAFKDDASLRNAKKVIKDANGNSTWDRLAEYLCDKKEKKSVFFINRSFDVDIETMFEAWTDPDQVVKWSGPTGAQMEYIDVDIRTGGSAFYKMPFGEITIYGKVQYIEVRKPDRLVYVQSFANQDGSPGRHPMAPTWPQSMLTTIEFSEEAHGGTRITLQWEVTGNWTQAELETFIAGRSGMTQGWTGSFDKLDEHLEHNK
ncbi:MAG: SRPBCC domain-containing protein [Bdellovibrionales bacterium]|nr:SRPBCC domain-containing protein [Bdellovibrionales bacterium]